MDDIFWKAGYLSLFIIWFCIQVYYGKQSAVNKVKEKVRPGFESFLVGLHFIGLTIPLLVVLTPFLDSFAIPLPEPVRFIFLIIFALNIWLFVVAHRDLGTNWSAILEIREGHRPGQDRDLPTHPSPDIYAFLDLGHRAGHRARKRTGPRIRDHCMGHSLLLQGTKGRRDADCGVRG